MPDALLVIPAFNERTTIGTVLERARSAAPGIELLVVDDGSHDGTAAVARYHRARVVSHPFNLGYGAALQTGYKAAVREGYRFVVQLDADGQHDPADIPRLLAPLRAGEAEVVIGSRFVEPTGYRMGLARGIGRHFFRWLLILCGGPAVADPTSGFQALARPAFRFCCADFYPSDFPDIDVLLLLHRRGFRVREVSVRMAPSPTSRVAMHSGLRDVYYTYKMLLSTFRSLVAPGAVRPVTAREQEE
jgi:glycosyltransferase involved in cell wall biosynthesis